MRFQSWRYSNSFKQYMGTQCRDRKTNDRAHVGLDFRFTAYESDTHIILMSDAARKSKLDPNNRLGPHSPMGQNLLMFGDHLSVFCLSFKEAAGSQSENWTGEVTAELCAC